jgi:hypothetical protein
MTTEEPQRQARMHTAKQAMSQAAAATLAGADDAVQLAERALELLRAAQAAAAQAEQAEQAEQARQERRAAR